MRVLGGGCRGRGGLSGGGIIGDGEDGQDGQGMGDGDGDGDGKGVLGFRVFSTFVVYLLCFTV